MPSRFGGFWRWRRSTTAATRTEAARIGGVGLQTIRDWVLRFNAGAGRVGRRQGAGPALEAR